MEEQLPTIIESEALPVVEDKTIDQDFDKARENLNKIVDAATNAINKLSEIADQSQHPRAYEVLATLITTAAAANKDLLEIHNKKKHLKKDSSDKPKTVTNNNLFVGSTSELQKILKDMRSKENNE